jgi:hypothetical protein
MLPDQFLRRSAVLAAITLAVTTLGCTSRADRAADTAADSGASPETARASAPAVGEDPAVPTAWVVRPDGIGPVRTGMTLAELSSVLGEQVRAAYADFEGCDYVRASRFPGGLALMVLNDTVARVDVDGDSIRTAEGARVGDSEERILTLYKGRVEVQPHKYTGPTGHYLVVSVPGDSLHRIIFETDGTRVTEYRAGRLPAVEFVEGCA